MAYDLKVLKQGCEELGITLNEVQKQQFITFYEYLVEKNKVMNLTGITEFQEVVVKHFLDSALLLRYTGEAGGLEGKTMVVILL